MVVEQSPSGQMEIISGTQEYDIKANWKLLVENSVDDYHIIATHTTWIQYMINSGVNITPQGAAAADQGQRRGPGQWPSDDRQPELSRAAGRELDFSLWRGCEGGYRPHPCRARAAPGRSPRRARRQHQPQSRDLPEPRHQRWLVGDGAHTSRRYRRPDARHRLGARSRSRRPRRSAHGACTPFSPSMVPAVSPPPTTSLRSSSAQQSYAAHRDAPWTDLSRGMGQARSSSRPTRAISAASGGVDAMMEARAWLRSKPPAP